MRGKTIVLVDDSSVYHSIVSELLRKHFCQYQFIGLKHGKELTELLSKRTIRPDLLLLDLEMPVLDGWSTASWMKIHYPSVPILILTGNQSPSQLLQAIQLGIRGLFIKNAAFDQIVVGIHSIMDGKVCFDESAQDVMRKKLQKPQGTELKPDQFAELQHQSELLKMKALEGLSNAECAQRICRTKKAVDARFSKMLRVMNVRGTEQLIHLAHKNGLL